MTHPSPLPPWQPQILCVSLQNFNFLAQPSILCSLGWDMEADGKYTVFRKSLEFLSTYFRFWIHSRAVFQTVGHHPEVSCEIA